ncbi:hypothetical protein EV182_000165 [Spiromyces aspiralis]|uniref:Uncharacterized protein n=1 Tax=Spiromyces aspiralis TaxID=68401 RepID=A0ACC1HH99_9FUNG|nr:hypothetical protein EV182_000165 [Spiromyces aspiralis]
MRADRNRRISLTDITTDGGLILSINRGSIRNLEAMHLPRELDKIGNVEYKTVLFNVSTARLMHLATQLQSRLDQGHGKAFYEIGVDDNGNFIGLTEELLEETISNLDKATKLLGHVRITEVVRREVMLPVMDFDYNKKCYNDSSKDRAKSIIGYSPEVEELVKSIQPGDTVIQLDGGRKAIELEARWVAEVVFVREKLRKVPIPNVRVALLGDHLAGKSSLVGHLLYGEADNGRGKCRLYSLRHRHEIESGETSSISRCVVGFDARSSLVNHASQQRMSVDEMARRSTHIVAFLDTCGKLKYRRTTIQALLADAPHAACLMIPSDATHVSDNVCEYLRLVAALDIPLCVVITKYDLLTRDLLPAAKGSGGSSSSEATSVVSQERMSRFSSLINDLHRAFTQILPDREWATISGDARGSLDLEIAKLAKRFMATGAASNGRSGVKIVPFFDTNCIDPDVAMFTKFLSHLSRPAAEEDSEQTQGKPNVNEESEVHSEFRIQDVFAIPDVGCVVSGRVLSGSFQASMPVIDGQVEIEIKGGVQTITIPASTSSATLTVPTASGNGEIITTLNWEDAIPKSVYYVGPDEDGNFHKVIIRSIQSYRVDIERADADQVVSMAIEFQDMAWTGDKLFQPRRGMVVLNYNPAKTSMKGGYDRAGSSADGFDLARWVAEAAPMNATGNAGGVLSDRSQHLGMVTDAFVARMTIAKLCGATLAPGHSAMIYTGSVTHAATVKAIVPAPKLSSVLSLQQGHNDDDSGPGDLDHHQQQQQQQQFGPGDTVFIYFQLCQPSTKEYLRLGDFVLYVHHPSAVNLEGTIVHLC